MVVNCHHSTVHRSANYLWFVNFAVSMIRWPPEDFEHCDAIQSPWLVYCWACYCSHDSVMMLMRVWIRDNQMQIYIVRIVRILPELVVVVVFIIYLEFGRCLLLFSNQFSTSSTACGFFFCSCLLMFELIRSRAHASGIPCRKSSKLFSIRNLFFLKKCVKMDWIN